MAETPAAVTTALQAQVTTKIRAAQEVLSLATPASGKDEFALFKDALPAESKPYAEILYAAALEYGITPLLVWGVMSHESDSGRALEPPGPAGKSADGLDLGLMQLNVSSNSSWLQTHDWRDPQMNIYRGAYHLYSNYQYFRRQAAKRVQFKDGRVIGDGGVVDPRPLSGLALTRAALAAYNAGPGNVLWAIASGQGADSVTTPAKLGQGKYSDLVLNKVAGVSQKLFAKGSILGSADALAVVVMSPVSDGPVNTVYRDLYAAMKAQERSAVLAATVRVDFYAEAASKKIQQYAQAQMKKVDVDRSAATQSAPPPGFKDNANLAALSYDFDRGTWGQTA